ncbi:HAMP domain-containing histidine kinase [Candidatus Bathyarchaeota archaeon]|nr:HAMP domain-containing histidine kinase [Candidatus Bathyarchaeota archaeon]
MSDPHTMYIVKDPSVNGDEAPEQEDNEEYDRRLIEEMGHISSELAHDLRSPLQTIQNALFLLERSPENPVFYAMIKDSLKQTSGILDSFREYYKGHILKPVEADIVKSYELAMSELDVPENVEVLCDSGEVRFTMDPTKTALVFKKLIKNSIDSMPDGGAITVEITDDGDHVTVRITDNGAGIPEETREVIYQPFLGKKKGGRGLGVPACKRIVEAHGGTIDFESVEGQGTTFTFTLPKG